MRIVVVGAGYVGLTAAAAFASRGDTVTVVESDAVRLAVLASGETPFREPGLSELVSLGQASGRILLAADASRALTSGALVQGERLLVLLAVGTPPRPDGGTDESQLLAAAHDIGTAARELEDCELILVIKSTAPVGAAKRVLEAARRAAGASEQEKRVRFSAVVNPEFLRSGHAVDDFLRPDRVVIGGDDADALDAVAELYAGIVPPERIMRMSEPAASLVKYAANAMLATRVSFMNELAALAAAVGADIEDIRRGVGADHRIGDEYLQPGMGFGGSCLPKDLSSLLQFGDEHGVVLGVARAVHEANERQSHLLASLLASGLGELRGAKVALWGLAFKGGADDLRSAPSLVLISDLLSAGAEVVAHDPLVSGAARDHLEGLSGVSVADSREAAIEGADALAIAADWPEFRSVSLQKLAATLRCKLVVDGRNLFDPEAMRRAGLTYLAVGRGGSIPPIVS